MNNVFRRFASPSLALALVLAAASPSRTLVMPFENLSSTEHAWLSEAFAEAVLAHLSACGEEVVERAERNRRLLEMGLPLDTPLTRASVIELGQSLVATRAVVGTFRLEEGRVQADARIVDLETAALIGVIKDEGALADLLVLQNQLAKNILRLEGASLPEAFSVSAARRKGIPFDAYQSFARALTREGEEQRALLEEALAKHPLYSEAKLLMGESFLRSGRAREAIEVLSAIRPEDPVYRRAYFTAGLAFLRGADFEAGAQVFGELARQEGAAAFYNNLAIAQLRAGKLPQALETLRSVVEPETPPERSPTPNPSPVIPGDLLFNLGWCAWQSGKGADALRWLRQAVERNPSDAEAQWLRAAAARSQALPEEAEEAQKRAIELSPRLAELDAATVQGLERVFDRLPTTAPVLAADTAQGTLEDKVQQHLSKARAHRDAGRREEAVRELQRAVYLSPYSLEARLELSRVYRDAGELEKAAGEARIAVWTAEHSKAHLLLAEILVSLSEMDEAREHAERAAELDPANAEAAQLLERLRAVKP
jgi:tetratricopeptide (TPR) repeat protein